MPFLLTGLGINQFLGFYKNFRKHLHKVEVVSGIVLIRRWSAGHDRAIDAAGQFEIHVVVSKSRRSVKTQGKTAPPPPAAQQTRSFEPAPDVEFQTLAGKPFRLKELQGQVVLLNFWATYCIPCREEIPALNSLQSELQAQGLKIVGASLDDSTEDVNTYQEEVAKFEYQVLLGGSDAKVKFAAVSFADNLPDRSPGTHSSKDHRSKRQSEVGSRSQTVARSEAPATASCGELNRSVVRRSTYHEKTVHPLDSCTRSFRLLIAAAQAGHEYSPLVEKTVNYKNWALLNVMTDKPRPARADGRQETRHGCLLCAVVWKLEIRSADCGEVVREIQRPGISGYRCE